MAGVHGLPGSLRRGRLSLGIAIALGISLLVLAMVLGVMIGPTTLGAGTVADQIV